jgi:transcriptional regulator with XRE-family HTH domain
LLPKKEILQKNFGNHVKELRLKKDLTQIDVSSRMNKDQQSLQRVESGNVSPSLYYLFELAEGLDISIVELLDFKVAVKKKKK